MTHERDAVIVVNPGMVKHSPSLEDVMISVLFGLGVLGVVSGVVATLLRVW